MQADVAASLITLNRQFYQTFAIQFSATRQRLQPGVRRAISGLPQKAAVLDLGCGNGMLARQLRLLGYRGAYLGLDSSHELVAIARENLPDDSNTVFLQADLTTAGWEALAPPSFRPDYALAFAVLHHIPGERLRRQFLGAVRSILAPESLFIHSEWQFLNSPRLRDRIQPWGRIGMDTGDVDAGDYLLDWRSGGTGLRYAHHFSEEELSDLARESGFSLEETFYSDGLEGNLGLYQVWRPANSFLIC